jgi:hypothetical protein
LNEQKNLTADIERTRTKTAFADLSALSVTDRAGTEDLHKLVT